VYELSNEELGQLLENAMEVMFSLREDYKGEERYNLPAWDKDLLEHSPEYQSQIEDFMLSCLLGEDLEQAKIYLQQLLILQPSNPVFQLYLALTHYVKGEETTAFSIAQLIDICALIKSRDKNEVIAAFTPDDDFPVDFPAIIDLSLLNHTLLLKPAIQRLVTNIQLYLMVGNHQKVITGFQQLLAVMGESSELLVELAQAHNSLKQYKEAKKLLRKAIKYDPQSIKALYLLATTNRDLGEYEQAIGFFWKYLKLEPTDYVVLFPLALCYEELQLTDKAVTLLEQVIEINPQLETSGWRLIPQIDKLIQIIQEKRVMHSEI